MGECAVGIFYHSLHAFINGLTPMHFKLLNILVAKSQGGKDFGVPCYVETGHVFLQLSVVYSVTLGYKRNTYSTTCQGGNIRLHETR